MARVPVNSLFGVIALALLASGCGSTGSTGSAGLKPVTYPDPSVPCPGGLSDWKLEVLDRRAHRDSSEGVQALVSESIRKSFPGCRWDSDEGAGRLLIEIHRFAAIQDGNSWEAAADWSVVASDSSGRTLTEFEATEEVSRPNYRGSNNEKEALRQAFDQAMRRTLAGLRSVTSAAVRRRPGRTEAERSHFVTVPGPALTPSPLSTSTVRFPASQSTGLERFSHSRTPEVL